MAQHLPSPEPPADTVQDPAVRQVAALRTLALATAGHLPVGQLDDPRFLGLLTTLLASPGPEHTAATSAALLAHFDCDEDECATGLPQVACRALAQAHVIISQYRATLARLVLGADPTGGEMAKSGAGA